MAAGLAVGAAVVIPARLIGNEPTPNATRPETAGAGHVADTDELQTNELRMEPAPGEPCAWARRVPLQTMIDRADVAVRMPNSAFASSSTLSGSWTCGGPTPFLTFAHAGGTVTVSFESGWADVDVARHWREEIRERGGGEVRTILGRPGLVLPAGRVSPLGMVHVVVDGVLFTVLGDGSQSAAALVAVAASLRESQVLARS